MQWTRINDLFYGRNDPMNSNWHRRSKRWQESQLNGMKQLYSEKLILESNLTSTIKTGKSQSAKYSAKFRKIEAAMQIALVAWALENNLFIFSIPNEGKRSLWTACLLKSMGLYKGASDLFLGERSKWDLHRGFFIELKAPGKKPTKNQLTFMQLARENGYKAEWYDNLDHAKESIKDYLEKEVTL